MSKNHDPELTTKLTGIRARIASVDHESFKGDCESFAAAVKAIVSADDFSLLLEHGPLISNLCCLFMQAGEAYTIDKIASGMANAADGGTFELPGMRVSIVEASRRRRGKNDGPKTPPTA